ncbi:hypothetical protein LINGRAPRIM_LOCUS276, partial [Linum grandiflorum]
FKVWTERSCRASLSNLLYCQNCFDPHHYCQNCLLSLSKSIPPSLHGRRAGVFSGTEPQFSTDVRCVLNLPLYKGPREINTTNMDLHTRKIREVQTTLKY